MEEFLVHKGYTVYEIVPGFSEPTITAIRKSFNQIHLDISKKLNWILLMRQVEPYEIYNLFSSKFGVDRVILKCMLEAIQECGLHKYTRICNAVSANVYDYLKSGQDNTVVNPPLESADSQFHSVIGTDVRYTSNKFITTAILCHTESTFWNEDRLENHITMNVARVHLGLIEGFAMRDLGESREWGSAKDYAEALWLTLQKYVARTYTLSTGYEMTQREIVERAFECIDQNIKWQHSGQLEEGIETTTGKKRVWISVKDDNLPNIPSIASSSRQALGWQPKINIKKLVGRMVKDDITLLENQNAGSSSL